MLQQLSPPHRYPNSCLSSLLNNVHPLTVDFFDDCQNFVLVFVCARHFVNLVVFCESVLRQTCEECELRLHDFLGFNFVRDVDVRIPKANGWNLLVLEPSSVT